ncbi:MAG TPA: CHAD domain-containing protein [Streptosporangiaceae bacterium]|nr:CHAD domain-containing protein [Streptosporangiaceae bacterium]
MSVCSHNFAYTDSERPVPMAVRDALAPRYSVVPAAKSRTLRRIWLDTFDWRLHRAGLTLECVAGRGPAELVLSGTAGERITATANGTRWPVLADGLPGGPLRDRLKGLTSVRALLPAAKAASTVSEFRVCNTDDKTVAWLTVDLLHPARPATEDPPARLCLTAVRGYQAQADRIAQCLAAQPGMFSGAPPPLDAVLATVGHAPGEYSNKVDVELSATMPARMALAAVLLQLLDTLEANVAGTIRDIDTEFLHDLRVSVRRTRTALKLGAALLPDGMAAQYRPEFKWLGDLTTPTRDLDVHLLGFDAGAAELTSADPADLAPFHDYLTQRRVVEQRRLARALRSARFTALTAAWRIALTGLTPPRRGPDAAHAAAKIIGRAHQRILTLGGAISADSPPEKLHDLRKRCKELRYALEFFASLHDLPTHRRAVRELKGLQDCLGTYQDCQVQQQEIRAIAADLLAGGGVPATALLAMGDLASHVGQRERRAHSEFSSRFAAFASSHAQARFEVLTASAHS